MFVFQATGSEPDNMHAGVEVTYDVSKVKSPSHLPDILDETPIEAIFYPDYQEYGKTRERMSDNAECQMTKAM